MAECIDNIATENVDLCAGQESPAGVSSTEIFAARISDFETVAAVPEVDQATTLSEACEISDSHIFPEGKGFFKVNILPETGYVECANEGEKGSKTNKNMFAGTLRGNSSRNLGFIRKYQNQGMVFLVREINGQLRQIGSTVSPAYMIEAAPNTGTKPGDVNGIAFKFEDIQSYPAPVYLGTITEFTPPVVP